ncbi:1-acyl-sn-glycerol-3-phosphate acyltransferase [Trichothermofontia sp.]
MPAHPPLAFIPPRFNPWVLAVSRQLLPIALRRVAHCREVQVHNGEQLLDLYRQFQAGQVRFLLAFRHPSPHDPFCMAHLLWRSVTHLARQQRVSLTQPLHAHFIYDRGIPLWAGAWVGWLYSQLGCTPIMRGKLDTIGLRSIRHLFMNGPFPLAAAPEGGTNGHNEVISPLEPGIAQMGFWCVEDLRKAERPERVLIVPIGMQYTYLDPPWQAVTQLLIQLERDSGLVGQGDSEVALYQRLTRLGEHLLTLMEQFYANFYPNISPTPDLRPTTAAAPIADRLQALLQTALAVAEQFFGINSTGSLIERCRRLEQAGWDRIYRQDLKDLECLSPVERGLADRVAEEAALRMWHMRLVETFVAVTGKYVAEKPTIERFAETTLLLWNTVTRLQGQIPFPLPNLGAQRVLITVGQPLSVSDRADDYRTNRRQAIATLTQDLQTALVAMLPSESPT